MIGQTDGKTVVTIELCPLGIRVLLVEPAHTRTWFEDNITRPDGPLAIYDAAAAFA